MTRILKTSRVFVPGGPLSHDSFYPLIRISGKWLGKLGFKDSAPLYITETVDGLLISPCPQSGMVISSLEQIKEEFKALDIETEQHMKPKRNPITSS